MPHTNKSTFLSHNNTTQTPEPGGNLIMNPFSNFHGPNTTFHFTNNLCSKTPSPPPPQPLPTLNLPNNNRRPHITLISRYPLRHNPGSRILLRALVLVTFHFPTCNFLPRIDENSVLPTAPPTLPTGIRPCSHTQGSVISLPKDGRPARRRVGFVGWRSGSEHVSEVEEK